MMASKFPTVATFGAAALTAAILTFAGCDGGSSGSDGPGGTGGGSPSLELVQYGRLVDIYAYRRIDPANDDRRDTGNRQPVRVATDVVINPGIETEQLFDAVGEARPDADFRFLPFDVNTGHDELLILWDDRHETAEYQDAFNEATTGLTQVAAAHRGQNILIKPIPVVPRNAALKLTFSAALDQSAEFYRTNPAAIQVLEFRDDPSVVPAPSAFSPADVRIVPKGEELIVDLTIIGGESEGIGVTSAGLEPSPDNMTANYRLAIPTEGVTGRLLGVSPDRLADQNGVDAFGNQAVIRDFRSGNTNDGPVGSLTDFDAPAIVAAKSMGIKAINFDERIITVDKRGADVAIRGRIPFVDGVLDDTTDLPLGPRSVPTVDATGNDLPLPHGDFVVQPVVSPATGETVLIRAEVIANLEVGTVEGDANFDGPGLVGDGTFRDSGHLGEVRLQLSTLEGVDSQGNVVRMEADPNLGAACTVTVRYYQEVRYDPAVASSAVVSDADRRGEFFVISPIPLDANGDPISPGTAPFNVQPGAKFAVRFSEPMDLDVVSSFDNFVLTTQDCDQDNFQSVLAEPKAATMTFVPSDLIDQRGDSTLLQLSPRVGLFHAAGAEEDYWFHIDLSEGNAVTDLSGNRLDIFDRRQPQPGVPLENFSVQFTLDDAAEENTVGYRIVRVADADEDGTKPGSIDFFGQFQVRDGELRGAQVTRRSRTADSQNLGSIIRFDKGECVDPGDATANPPVPPTTVGPSSPPSHPSTLPGTLYQTPDMNTVQPGPPLVFQPPAGPQPFGGIVEPHTSRGARLQMTYREDDFGLSYHNANDLNIDVEQLHWAPWADSQVLFDRFDRYTMSLAHSKKRPDLLYSWFPGDDTAMPPAPPGCGFDCLSLYSGLELTFAENVLPDTAQTEVIVDKEWVINPNDAFLADSGIKYVPYPEFADTFTWRDNTQVSWDPDRGEATGLGGAQDAVTDPPDGDRTASVSSPWIQDDPASSWIDAFRNAGANPDDWVHEQLVRDEGDFLGDRTEDHDPIALPLLVDISVWPDDSRQVANAGNLFHIAYVGPIWTPVNPGGYYNAGAGVTTIAPPQGGVDPFNCTNIDWPFFRVFTAGGEDPNNPGRVNLIEPDRALVARGGVIKDMGLGNATTGLVQTKPGDSHLHWAQIDLVRRKSVVTFGFFDTLRPNLNELTGMTPPIVPASVPASGRPDLTAFNGGDVRVSDLSAVLDPPANLQPGGTSVEFEIRGATGFDNDDTVYDRVADDVMATRGNLLNPNYACEAYRYAMPNPGAVGDGQPRIEATGLTPYVRPDQIDLIRNPVNGLLPRYLNFRLVMENNIDATPAVSPRIRGLAIVYRVAPTN